MANVSTILMALSVFTFAILSFGLFFDSTVSEYNINNTDTGLQTFDRFDEIGNNVTAISDNLRGSKSQDPNFIDGITALVTAAFDSVKLAWNSLTVAQDLIVDVGIIFHLPPFVANIVFVLLTILLVFTVMSALLRWSI